MSKIELTDTFLDSIEKVAEGNPGAAMALMTLVEATEKVDPQSALGPLSPILSLDTHEIYGSDIYILFNDKCDRNPRKMLMLLRAVQLGFLNESKLKEMAADQMRQVNLSEDEFKDLDQKVCDTLDEFERP